VHAADQRPASTGSNARRKSGSLSKGSQSNIKALYLAHKGEVFDQSGKSWESVIGQDFAEFRKAGLTHPMMVDIEKELGISR
jgi:hypothetical protein